MRRDQSAPVVVAGIGPVAFPITLAALRTGHRVVRLLTGPHGCPGDADDRAARLAAAAPAERLTFTTEPTAGTGFEVAVLTESAAGDAPEPAVDEISPIEHYAAALAPQLRRECLLAVSSATAEHAGDVVDATLELLTGLCAGRDYALAYLFQPATDGRVIVSGVDGPSVERASAWLDAIGLPGMPIMPVATAEVVATLLARADPPGVEH